MRRRDCLISADIRVIFVLVLLIILVDQDTESIYNLIQDADDHRSGYTFEEHIEDETEGKRRKGHHKGDLEIDIEDKENNNNKEKNEEILDENGRNLGRSILEYLWDLIMNNSNIKGVTQPIITNVSFLNNSLTTRPPLSSKRC